MCGILVHTNTDDGHQFSRALGLMEHRGPDANAITMPEPGIMMGHQRLSILDLTRAGAQPMRKGQVELVFNGEIYNFRDLKSRHNLKVKSTGDTEVILELYRKIGEKVFSELDGEFSIVLYDGKRGKIFAARDRMGIKPLYYSSTDNGWILSSEIRGILPYLKKVERDYKNWEEFLLYGYSPRDRTLFRGVQKLLPGVIYEFQYRVNRMKTHPYYNLIERFEELEPFTDYEEAKDTLRRKLTSAVRKRMISDVPITATLSGGIDSSIIVGLMSQIGEQVKTYTIGFDGYDEFSQARVVAEHFGTQHEEINIPLAEVIRKMPEIVRFVEEPMDKGSIIPSYFIGQAISEKVTLIGEGADECFAGYNRHIRFDGIDSFTRYFDRSIRVFPQRHEESFTPYDKGIYTDLKQDPPVDGNVILLYDLLNEIPGYHNLRIDKLFMSNSVEARVPYLDPGVVETALRIPYEWKQNPEKKILRDTFSDLLPDEVLNRKKKALKIPTDEWVKDPQIVPLIDEAKRFIKPQIVELLDNSDDTLRNKSRMQWIMYLSTIWNNHYF